MNRSALALVAVLSSFAAAQPADEKSLIEQDRKDAREWLKSDPTSYLAAVQRVGFESKPVLTVGTAADNDLRLEDPGLRPHHLKIEVKGDKFRVAAVDAGAEFRVGKSTAAAVAREATIDPAYLRVGRHFLRLSHQGYPAIIAFDPKSAGFKKYHGIEYFPVDLAYRFVLKLKSDAAAAKVAIESSASAERSATRVGWFEFTLGGKPYRLAAYHLEEPGVEPGAISVFFRDATTGHESYSVGRYLEPKKQTDGTFVLDFNRAYSPACAFSNDYNCPIPPKENRLPVAIKAGEKNSHYH